MTLAGLVRTDLLGRLGEGGMGTVYLARGPQGIPVAVKMVRADLDLDGEFRRRFRSEVNRARQVPPFCTAEVLDADPDHEHHYLVVEYVDAPSLAEVVQERGPLSAAKPALGRHRGGYRVDRDPRRGRHPPRPQAAQRATPAPP